MDIYPKFKRMMDVVVSMLILILCAPLLLAVAIVIKVDSRGPIFFSQRRLGKGGREFLLHKFRSMYDRSRLPDRQTYADDPEVTRVGRVLRRLKLDELPQLWNVVRGEMSLIGPRPALPEQLDVLSPSARRRLHVYPGLTGLAQVHGNILLSWPQRWRYDILYADRMSLALDCWIMWRTLLVLVFGEGVTRRTVRPRGDS